MKMKPKHFLLFLLGILVYLIFAMILMFHQGYKVGQDDALKGTWKYEITDTISHPVVIKIK